MSHIDATALAVPMQPHDLVRSSDLVMTEAQLNGPISRGLAIGLFLALSFWAVVAMLIWAH